LYGWSKYAAEDYVRLNGGIGLRYFNVYGPGEENKGRMSSVAYQMYMKKLNNEEVYLFPKKPTRDFVYVKDIISANIYAFENYESLSSKWYEVGSGESRPFEDVLKIMKLDFVYLDESVIPQGYQFYTCSNSKKWLKGWKPKYNLELGLKDYFDL
jgi:ADP-L-glycero-D-manno-heptose 6-epimerase